MLVLSRKVGEMVVIDGNITVRIVRIQGSRITVGIEAPSDVKILRGELKLSNATAQVASSQVARSQAVELIVEDGVLVPC